MYRVFIVEDDDGIADLYSCAFISANIDIEIFTDAESMFQALEISLPDCLILDIMLPVMDGITALKSIKQNKKYSSIPVIMVSAKDEEMTIVKGLVSGAEDYITKPFKTMELIARVKKVLERSMQSCTLSGLVLDDKKRKVYYESDLIILTLLEYKLIKALYDRRGVVVERATLFDLVWGVDYFSESRTLDIHMNAIRQKISKFTSEPIIKTVRGVGFIID